MTESGSLKRDGLRYGYRVHRHPAPEFPPVLFVSGAFQTMRSWTGFAEVFERHTTVLLLDPPGTGNSDVLPATVEFDFLTGCVLDALDALAFERINLVAASYGTPVGLRMAQLHPNRLHRVVLAGTMKRIPPHVRPELEATLGPARRRERTLMARQVIEGLLCRDPTLPIDKRRVAEHVLRSSVLNLSDTALQQYVANTLRLLRQDTLHIDTPIRGPEALVFTGEHDTFTTPAACREIAEAFERAWFTTVCRADHLFHIERFDITIELLLRFMRGTMGEPIEGCTPPIPIGAARAA